MAKFKVIKESRFINSQKASEIKGSGFIKDLCNEVRSYNTCEPGSNDYVQCGVSVASYGQGSCGVLTLFRSCIGVTFDSSSCGGASSHSRHCEPGRPYVC